MPLCARFFCSGSSLESGSVPELGHGACCLPPVLVGAVVSFVVLGGLDVSLSLEGLMV